MKKKLVFIVVAIMLLFAGCASVREALGDESIIDSIDNGGITAYPDGTTKINEGEHPRTPN